MLSSAISAVTDWPQLWSIVERYGRYLTANNVTHALTKLEQLVQGQQYRPAEASQVGCSTGAGLMVLQCGQFCMSSSLLDQLFPAPPLILSS